MPKLLEKSDNEICADSASIRASVGRMDPYQKLAPKLPNASFERHALDYFGQLSW